MPHSVDTLAALNMKTDRDTDITMQLLAEYYEKYIMAYQFEYTLDDSNETKIILNPLRDNFPHLVSMETIAKAKYGQNNKNKTAMYTGADAFKGAKNGRLNFDKLQKLHPGEFERQRDKHEHFHFMHKVLENPKAVKYVVKKGKLVVDFIFYDSHDKALVQVGIQETANGTYVPRSFIARYLSNNKYNHYIKDQKPVNLKGSVIKTPKVANSSPEPESKPVSTS